MEIHINLTQQEEGTLNALINLMISFGLEHQLFSTKNSEFLDKHRYTIQETFKENGIIEWYPEGCGYVKFQFTKLGFGLIKVHAPEVFENLKPFLPFRAPSISAHHLPKVKVKIIKEKATA